MRVPEMSAADYRIERADGLVRVCRSFENANRAARYPTLPPFGTTTTARSRCRRTSPSTASNIAGVSRRVCVL
jgi:hypothetical protein